MSEEPTKNIHVRALPKDVHDELRRAAEANYRTVNAQILYVLTQWAEQQRQSR
jgi:hypothetical protein